MTLQSAIDKASKELPIDWQICIVVKNSVHVELFSPEGVRITPDSLAGTIPEQIEHLLVRANNRVISSKRKP